MKNKVEGNMQQAIASDVECELVAYMYLRIIPIGGLTAVSC